MKSVSQWIRENAFARATPAPSIDTLRKLAKKKAIPTRTKNLLFRSNVTARSAAFTNSVEDDDGETLRVLESVPFESFYSIVIRVGSEAEAAKQVSATAAVLVPQSHPNLALMIASNFWRIPDMDPRECDILSVDLATVGDESNRKVWLCAKKFWTVFRGIDYYGELKMSVLRMAMERMRATRVGIGLHAGSKTFQVVDRAGIPHLSSGLIFGLSGTGKTTVTCHTHDLKPPERIFVLQDDVTFLTNEGEMFGAERFFYVKCDNCPEHPSITKAVLNPESVLENVAINSKRELDWKNFRHTRNTRALVPRSALVGGDCEVDGGHIDWIAYNTRRPEMPPICRLTSPEQVAAYYALGESIITSAEDPSREGESKRQAGFDPFITGHPERNVAIIRKIAEGLPSLEVFVLNTGYVRSSDNNISVHDTVSCLEAAVRGKLKWTYDPILKVDVPINGFPQRLSPHGVYGSNYASAIETLRSERQEYLTKLRVDPEVIASI